MWGSKTILFALLSFSIYEIGSGCTGPYVELHDGFYCLGKSTHSFDEAEKECNTYGGNLATVKDKETNEAIIEKLLKPANLDGNMTILLGGKKGGDSHRLAEPGILTYPETREKGRNCIGLNDEPYLTYIDCDNKKHGKQLGTVCQRPADSTGGCSGFDKKIDDMCYVFKGPLTSWNQVRKACAAANATLVTLKSMKQFDKFSVVFVNAGRVEKVLLGKEKTFEWSDGTQFEDGFTDWSAASLSDGDCMGYVKNLNYKWGKIPCKPHNNDTADHIKLGYICKKKKEVSGHSESSTAEPEPEPEAGPELESPTRCGCEMEEGELSDQLADLVRSQVTSAVKDAIPNILKSIGHALIDPSKSKCSKTD